MRKYLVMFILICTLFIMGACSEDEDRSFTIDDVTIDAQVDEAGIIHVRELYTYTFDGSFQGMTRTIGSDFKNFKAFLMHDIGDDPTVGTDWLEQLTIEKEGEGLKIYSESTDETKQVLYSYKIIGSVNKYQDIADLSYAFFDESNETDLDNLQITIRTPAEVISEQTHIFAHGDAIGELTVANDHLLYTDPLLEAGDISKIRVVFPATELPDMNLTKDKQMGEKILASEFELLERRAVLQENMEKASPIIWISIGTALLVMIMIFIIQPNRYRGDKGIESLMDHLEATDPLFISYIDMNGAISDEGLIASLFSLKQRGIITLKEVPSLINKEETTFRFTWTKDQIKVDAADRYFRKWLFTKKDKSGMYFLMESIIENENEAESIREEKADKFEENQLIWSELVEQRGGYEDLRQPFKPFSIFSVALTIISFGLFYYFTKIDVISPTQEIVLPLILAVLGILNLIFRQNKWPIFMYYPYLIFMALITFTVENATIFALFFYLISFIILMIIPSHYWRDDVRKIKYAMSKIFTLFHKGRYPVGSDPDKIERRLEYAIILGVGEKYAEQCGKEGHLGKLKANHPLLSNPIHATESFNTNNLLFLSTVAISSSSSSTTSSSTSSTGGGGAGAF